MKVVSKDILHKSDAGGVKLNLRGEAALRNAYDQIMSSCRAFLPSATIRGVLVTPMARKGTEVIIGVSRDPIFGPVMMFGLGGIFVEILEDVAFRAIPLSRHDARSMVEQIKARKILEGARGEAAVDKDALVDLLLRSRASSPPTPALAELDLNPIRLRRRLCRGRCPGDRKLGDLNPKGDSRDTTATLGREAATGPTRRHADPGSPRRAQCLTGTRLIDDIIAVAGWVKPCRRRLGADHHRRRIGVLGGWQHQDMAERGGDFAGDVAECAERYRHGIQRIPLALQEVEVPIIAAVNGPAIGAGFDLANMADIRIASEKARFMRPSSTSASSPVTAAPGSCSG